MSNKISIRYAVRDLLNLPQYPSTFKGNRNRIRLFPRVLLYHSASKASKSRSCDLERAYRLLTTASVAEGFPGQCLK